MKTNKIRLGEQCVVTSSKRFHLSERITQGVPFYCSKEIIKKFNGEDVTECDYISEDLYKKVSNEFGVPKENDLLITTRGTIGIPYLYKRTDRFYFADGNLTWIKDFDSNLYSKFLYYWFQSYEGRKKFEALAKGTAQKAVPISGIKTLEIELPSLKSQKRIADILSAYDDLIENNQKQIKLLEEAAQRLYKEWFVDLHFPGHENTKIVDGVPEGWNECTVENFGTVITGKTPPTSNKEYYTNGKVPFVTIPDMHNVVYPLKTEKRLTIEGAQTQKNKYIPPNSVMISCIGTVGLVSIATEVCQTNQQINSIILNNEDDLYFFYESMLRMKDLLDGLGSNGATMTNVNKSKLEKLIIISPSKDIVKQYNDVCKPLFESALNLSRKNVYLKNMREALLPKLMSGEAEI